MEAHSTHGTPDENRVMCIKLPSISTHNASKLVPGVIVISRKRTVEERAGRVVGRGVK